MPDFVRVGPPYGAINLLHNPTLTGNYTPRTQSRGFTAGAGDNWGIDKWQPGGAAPTTIGSWSGVATAPDEAAVGFLGWDILKNQPTANSWQIYFAGATVGGQIAAASIPLPAFQAGGGPFMFEVWARSASPIGLSVSVLASQPIGGTAAVAFPFSGTMIAGGTAISATWLRYLAVASLPSSANAVIAISAASMASGNFVQLSCARFQAIPSLGDVGGTYFYGDTPNLLPAPVWPATYLGAALRSYSARSLQTASYFIGGVAGMVSEFNPWDAQQPVGLAVEIGSAIIPDQADYGAAALIDSRYIDSVSQEGGPLAYEDAKLRTWQLPLISRRDTPQGVQDLTAALQRAVRMPGAQLVFKAEGASNFTYFDIQGGYFAATRDVRYARAGLMRGSLRVDTTPFGYQALAEAVLQAPMVNGRVASAMGFATTTLAPSMPMWFPQQVTDGDVPPALSFSFQPNNPTSFGGSNTVFGAGNAFFAFSPWPIQTGPSRFATQYAGASRSFSPSIGSYGYGLFGPAGNPDTYSGSALSSAGLGAPTSYIWVGALGASSASFPDRFRVVLSMAVGFASAQSLPIWAEVVNPYGQFPAQRGPIVTVPAIPSVGASAYHRPMLFDLGEFSIPSAFNIQPPMVAIGANVASFSMPIGSQALWIDTAMCVPADGLIVFSTPSNAPSMNQSGGGNKYLNIDPKTGKVQARAAIVAGIDAQDYTAYIRGRVPIRPAVANDGGELGGFYISTIPFAYYASGPT
ncbi:MAG TPA: hypothetical protein VLH12_05955, partial [Usitatibacter sp.]|nr:hypothetical protein [Usitatibacter sp.]